MYYNMSLNLQRLGENIQDDIDCAKTQEQKEYLRSLNISLSSMIVKTAELIQIADENLKKNLEEHDEDLKFIYQNFSSRFDA